jgi:hypothetical protein
VAWTTLDIDPSVLHELEERARAEGKSAGEMASLLLAAVLKTPAHEAPAFLWRSQPMNEMVDLQHADRVQQILDEEMLGETRE